MAATLDIPTVNQGFGALLASHLGDPAADDLFVAAAAAYERVGASELLAKLQSGSQQPTSVRPHPFEDLTPREEEVLVLIARGLSNDDIALARDAGLA